MKFKDSQAKIGRPFKAPETELKVKARPFSRSLKKLSDETQNPKILDCNIKNNKLIINTSNIIRDKIEITKTNAVAFARWILISYLEDEDDNAT